jgi:outer membrane receptor for ferrienterochelin and colicins
MIIIKKAFLFSVILLITLHVSAQNQLVQVLDKLTGDPVPFAYVCIESLDKKVKSNNLTDANGKVNILVDRRVQVAVSSVGYTSFVDTINPGASMTFYLEQAPTGLNEVVVTGQLTPQRVDKSIYKVNVISGLQID